MDFPLKIRAHHLLCLQGYQGYGYSDDFKANLERIRKLINRTPDLEMEVTAENDIICNCCPYWAETGCAKDEDSAADIRSMDLTILSRLKLTQGMKEKAQTLIMSTRTVFGTRLDVQEICGDCQWQEKCLWFQKLPL
jgi:hypothetical protein